MEDYDVWQLQKMKRVDNNDQLAPSKLQFALRSIGSKLPPEKLAPINFAPWNPSKKDRTQQWFIMSVTLDYLHGHVQTSEFSSLLQFHTNFYCCKSDLLDLSQKALHAFHTTHTFLFRQWKCLDQFTVSRTCLFKSCMDIPFLIPNTFYPSGDQLTLIFMYTNLLHGTTHFVIPYFYFTFSPSKTWSIHLLCC